MTELNSKLTVRDLRRRFKPNKERLARAGNSHPLSIRLHRAFSWMAAVEGKCSDSDQDQALLFLWIAFNALYGRWDRTRQIPESDSEGIRNFIAKIQKLDEDSIVRRCIEQNKNLAIELISDQYLNKRFWRSLSAEREFKPQTAEYLAKKWVAQGEILAILDELLERIYFNRCQLFHGAATFESKLNRTSVARSALMLNELLHAMLIVIIDHGMLDNWEGLCYPPLNQIEKTDELISIAKKNPK